MKKRQFHFSKNLKKVYLEAKEALFGTRDLRNIKQFNVHFVPSIPESKMDLLCDNDYSRIWLNIYQCHSGITKSKKLPWIE